MDKGIKQRLLGGIVLVAGAILLLPYVIENAGTGLPPRPEIPAKPAVPSADDMAPKLDPQQADLDKAVDEAHSDQNFYPVGVATSAAASAPAATLASAPAATPLPIPEEDVPAAQPNVVADKAVPAAEAVAAAAAAKLAADKVAADKVAAQKEAADEKAAQARAAEQKAVDAKAAAAKALADKAAAAKKLAAAAKPPADNDDGDTDATAAATAVDAPAKPEAPKKEDSGLPQAWLVQVASLGTQDKANQLVARLHKHGYHASTHASGPYWRVTVGPELSKDMAESLRQKLASDPELKLAGWVQPYHP